MRPVHHLALLLAALGCQAAPPPDTTAEAKQAIDAANASWARLTATGHADSLAQYYHANAVIMPPNMTPVHGRDSIRAFFTVLNTMSSPPPCSPSVRTRCGRAVRWPSTWDAGTSPGPPLRSGRPACPRPIRASTSCAG